MMAATTLTVEESNHLRAVHLCYRVAPEAVRAYFDKQHPPSQLVTDLTADKYNLLKLKGKILKQYQWDQLYLTTGTNLPASTDFDITLLICLLRNMKPTMPPPPFGFDNLPHSSHTTDGAHVARIKYYRNRLAHSTDGKLSNTDFANYWSDLEVATVGLGGSQFGKEVNDAKARNLDNTLAEILRQLTKYDKQYVELSNGLNELKSEQDEMDQENTQRSGVVAKRIKEIEDKLKNKSDVMDQENTQRSADVAKRIRELEDRLKNKSDEMSNLSLQLEQQSTRIDKNATEIRELQKAIAAMKMENIPNNRKELIRMQLEKWKECDAMFIQTRAADKVYTMMKKNSCLTVTGNSGMGKTMTVRHVALKMLEKGYPIVPISHPEEIVTLFSTQKKTLFVVDDLCGKYTLNQGYLDRLKLKMEDIKLILENQYCKIIATCRLQVFRDVNFKTLSFFNVFECNLNSKDIHLTPKEITTFAAQYFGEHADESVILSTQYDCFPFLCNVYYKTKDADFYAFCKNPFQFFGEEIDNLLFGGEEGKYKYCVLVLCVIYNNNLTEGCFTGKHDMTTREIFEEVFGECELNRGTSPKCLHRALQTLVGTFVIKEENCYKMIHDKLFDIIAFYFGQKMINILIEHADSGFLKERFVWGISDDKENRVDFAISIPDDVVDTYIDRMIRDWTNKKVVDFFGNSNLKSPIFTDKVVCHLKKLDKDHQLHVNLANTIDAANFYYSSLMSSCQSGYVKLIRWILEQDYGVTKCTFDLASCLDMTCQEGNAQIVRELVLHGADVNKCDKDGWPPLYMACYNQQIDVVSELLKTDNVLIDMCCNLGRTTLNLSCGIGCTQIIRDLLQHGADINKYDKDGRSPLYTACYYGRTEVVTELLKNNNVKIDLCDNDGRSPLYMACQKGYVRLARDLVQNGADINKCRQHGWSPLHTASYNGHTEVVTELLKNDNVKINSCNNDGWSPLYMACQKGYIQIVRCLFQHGAYIKKCRQNGWSPLHTASYNGHTEVVTELLKNDNVKIDLCDNDGWSSLYMACQKGYTQIVRNLLQHGADIKKCRQNGRSPLHTASYNGHTEVVTELLKNDKVKINLRDNDGRSPLYMACQQGYVRIAGDLLQHGADINKCRQNGWSPLHTASYNGHTEVVTELLKNDNVKIDLCDNDGWSSLYMACQEGYVLIVRDLLKHGADINKCRQDGWSPLQTASFNGHTEVVTELLKNDNVKMDVCDNEGLLPLYSACQNGYAHIVRDLLQHGADMNKCDNDGWSSLNIASYNGHTEVVTELLKIDNVAIDSCNNNGSSTLYMACQKGYVQIVRDLAQHGADINKCNNHGNSPLQIACINNHKYIVSELLKIDVMLDVQNNDGVTALYLACEEGHNEIGKLLLDRGVNENKCNNHGNSPLQIACMNNHKDIVTELLKYDVMLDAHDNNGDTALYLACAEGHTEIVKLLLDREVNVNKCSNTGESPLLVSCVLCNIDIVDMLLNKNANVNLCIQRKGIYMEEIRKYKNIHK